MKKGIILLALLFVTSFFTFLWINSTNANHGKCIKTIENGEDSGLSFDEARQLYDRYSIALIKVKTLDFPDHVSVDQKASSLYYAFEHIAFLDGEEITYNDQRCIVADKSEFFIVSSGFGRSVFLEESYYVVALKDAYQSSYQVMRDGGVLIKEYDQDLTFDKQSSYVKDKLSLAIKEVKRIISMKR